MEQLKATTTFDETIGHYRVGLPWAKGHEEAAKALNKLGSLMMVLNRLWKTSAWLRRDPARRAGVMKSMKMIFDEGHARKVNDSE